MRKDDRTHYRTVWISDAHLGSRASQSRELARFLKHLRCDKLYLVGDIVDFWRLRSKPYWPACHHKILRRVLKRAQQGSDVIFIPGNHDEAARKYIGFNVGGVHIREHDIHITADDRKLYVVHGDEYDLVVQNSKLLSALGSAAYEWLVTSNRWYNAVRMRLGLPRRHFSMWIKGRVKSACQYISAFEETLIREASRRKVDGIVCGHIHKPEIIEDGEVQYFNCGDWIEHCTALVEHYDGRIELLHHQHDTPSADDDHDDDLIEFERDFRVQAEQMAGAMAIGVSRIP